MIILIPLEIGVREIYSKTFLSFFLAKKCKAKVYLFNARSLFKKIKKLKNCIFFDKSLSNTKIEFHQSVMKDNFLVSLDEEGPVYNWDKYVFNGRNPEQVYEKLAGNLLVSSYEKKFFKKKHFNKLFIVGHPKYDLLKKDYISLYEQDGNSLKKKFSNYIYFSSSFSFDTIGGYKNFLLFNKKSFLSGKDGKILYQQFLNFQKNDFINYSLFLETVVEVANRFPKKKIIFRPHPSQDLKDVKKKIKKNSKKFTYNLRGICNTMD